MSRFDGDPLEDGSKYRSISVLFNISRLPGQTYHFQLNFFLSIYAFPSIVQWTAFKRILPYLKGSVDYRLYFGKCSLNLNAYTDTDLAGGPDDRRSTGGFGVFHGPCLVSWSAKK